MTCKVISERELNSLGANGKSLAPMVDSARGRRKLRSGTAQVLIPPVPLSRSPSPSPSRSRSSSPAVPVSFLNLFSLFSKLPEEQRKQIWTMAIPRRVLVLHYDTKNDKLVTGEPNIALLSVSKEARECALQIVIPTFQSASGSGVIYIDVEQDKFFMDPGLYGDLGRIILQWHSAISPQHFRRIERLDIGLYENRKNSAMNCVVALGESLLLDQANLGMPFTQVRLLAHTPFTCDLERHTTQMFTVGCKDQVQVQWEEDLVAKVREVNGSLLEIARYYRGPDTNNTYKDGEQGPIKLEVCYGFCGLQGIEE